MARRLASVLGIDDGEVREQDGAVVIEDGRASLGVSSSGDWHYFDRDVQLVEACPPVPAGGDRAPQPEAAGAEEDHTTPEGGQMPEVRQTPEDGTVPEAGTIAGAGDPSSDYDCEEPELPAEVPSTDEADQAARAFFEQIDTAGPIGGLVSHASDRAVSVDGVVEVGVHPGALRCTSCSAAVVRSCRLVGPSGSSWRSPGTRRRPWTPQ